MQFYQMGIEEITGVANDARQLVIGCLLNQGVISPEAAEWAGRHVGVICFRPGFWGRLWDKLVGIKKDEDGFRLRVMTEIPWAQHTAVAKDTGEPPSDA